MVVVEKDPITVGSALDLIHSNHRFDIEQGISVLEEMIQQEEYKDNKELLFYISFGYHRNGRSIIAKEWIERLLSSLKDDNNEMKELKKHASDFSILIDDQRSTNAKIGFVFSIVCGIIIILGWDKFKRR